MSDDVRTLNQLTGNIVSHLEGKGLRGRGVGSQLSFKVWIGKRVRTEGCIRSRGFRRRCSSRLGLAVPSDSVFDRV